MELSTEILSDITVYLKYAKYIPELRRRETWDEMVTRNKEMHLEIYKNFEEVAERIHDAFRSVYEKKVLPSMRSMQFAGKPIELNPARMYNCCFLPMDHPDTFAEVMFLLLSGVGVGYSVQMHHVDKLPPIIKPIKTRRYLVGDSIEGWADAVKVLLKAYLGTNGGKALPKFDFRDIRAKGARLITSGGKAPGPEPLKDCLHNIQKVLDRKETGERLSPLEVHDINCYIADAVLAGGIRRSAMIALFSFDDDDMLSSKFGDWYELNPHRARANNSAVILRHKIQQDEFMDLWEKIRAGGTGEPGFMFSNDQEWGLNPCAEISLRANQFCNLVTINVSDVHDQEDLNARAKAAATIATLQAGYTNFHYLRDIWETTTKKEALIGVSMTGIASGGVLKLDLKEAAKIIQETNEEISKALGLKKAARCTTVKPEGTSSLVLGSSSGIHAWHAPYYIRRVKIGKNEAIYPYLERNHPELIKDEYFKPHLEAVVEVPQKAPTNAITRSESAMDLLDRVAHVFKDWIRPGHRRGHNTNNVSTTVTIKDGEWDNVGTWMWENRDKYTALAILPYVNHNYKQLPFEDIDKDRYEEMARSLHKIDLTKVLEYEDATELKEVLACGGNSCEVS
jgi:ribonucleoside-diphosphate reductase alpha chain